MTLKTIFYKTFSNLSNVFQFKKKLSTTTTGIDQSFNKHNFLEIDGNLINPTLKKMTVKQLKELCKKNNLFKYSKLNKENLISLLTTHFLTVRASLLEEDSKKIVSSNVPMVLNEKEHINVSIWFRIADIRLSRWLESKAFNEILNEHCESEKVTKDDVITKDKSGDTYLDLLLALATAAQFNSKLRYDILKFYKSKLDELKKKDASIAALRHQLQLVEQGISAEVTQRWETFNFPFAYYIILIDNIVKCGVVGLNNSENLTSLDARFSSHRNTHVRFLLINVFQFQDSKSVTRFENWIKMFLEKYSIGKAGGLEQYECKNQDTAVIINKIVTDQFEALKKSNPQIGSMCPKEKIEKYNQFVQEKTNN